MPSRQLDEQPLGDLYWLGVHDGYNGRPLLPDRTRHYGLAAALIAELVRGGYAYVARDPQHRSGAPAQVFLAMGAPPPADPAVAELYAKLRPASARSDLPHFPHPGDTLEVEDGGYRPGRHAYGAAGWAEHLPPGDGSQPPLTRGPDWRTGQDISEFLAFWASGQQAERLVVGRLKQTGLVRVEVRRKVFKGLQEIVVPADSTVSGFPLTSISAMLRDSERPPAAYEQGTEPWRLPPALLLLAALFAATRLYDVPQVQLDKQQKHHLKEQLSGLDPQLRLLIEEVQRRTVRTRTM